MAQWVVLYLSVLSWLAILDRTYKLTSLDYILDQIMICGNVRIFT